MASSPSGFRVVQAETRYDRARRADKESLEKGRLAERKEKFQRYDPIVRPTEPPEDSLGFCPDAERFHTDVAGEEKHVRDQRIARQNQVLETKRERHFQREERRWENMEHMDVQEQERVDNLQHGMKPLRNKNSVAYDPLTLEYHESDAGKSLKHHDDMLKYRAKVRTVELVKAGTGDGYNPITGEPLRMPNMPQRPQLGQ